jgi:hypothetical protein
MSIHFVIERLQAKEADTHNSLLSSRFPRLVLMVEFIKLASARLCHRREASKGAHYALPDLPLNAFETNSSCKACKISPLSQDT